MKKNSKSIGGIRREDMMLASGYCLGLSYRTEANINKHDRRILRVAAKSLRAACQELWPEWFKH